MIIVAVRRTVFAPRYTRIFSVLSCHLKIFSLVSLLFLASIARVIPTQLFKFLIFKYSCLTTRMHKPMYITLAIQTYTCELPNNALHNNYCLMFHYINSPPLRVHPVL